MMDDHIMDSQNEDYGEIRPAFYIGQHDSTRTDTLNDLQYGQILNAGVSFHSLLLMQWHDSTQYLLDYSSVL